MQEDPETVRTFSSETEAHLAMSRLTAENIPATVHRFSRYRSLSSGGYLLKTSPQHVARARAILAKLDTPVDMDEYVSSDDDSYTRCPSCNSVNTAAAPLPTLLLLVCVLLLGIPLLFIKRNWTCAKCGHAWRQ